MTLMPTLNIIYSVAITLKQPSRITSQNLGNFLKKSLWLGFVMVKTLFLGITIIFFMSESVVPGC